MLGANPLADARRQSRRTAHQEAGHAVTAFVLGAAVGSATIAASDNYAGRCWIDDQLSDAPAAIMISFGDVEAEKKCCADRSIDDERAASRRHDLADIRRIAATAGLDHREVADLQTEARKLIFDHWSAVHALALELRFRTTLDGRSIERVISNAINY